MTAVEVISALGARRTVRIQYSRCCDSYSVCLTRGDRVVSAVVYVSPGEFAEELAERVAVYVAERRGLDVTRLDIP